MNNSIVPVEIKFVFDLPAQRGNRRGHSRWEFAKEKKWSEMQTLANLPILRSNKIFFPFKAVRWKSAAIVKKEFDFDNLVALHKWVLDWMVDNGVIENDDPKHCWPMSLPEQVVRQKESPKLILAIYPRFM